MTDKKQLKLLSNAFGTDPYEDIALLCKTVHDLNGKVPSREEIADALRERGLGFGGVDVDRVVVLLPEGLRPVG